MIWYYGNEKPASVEKRIRLGQIQHTVNFNVEEINEGGYTYRWQSVTLEPGVFTYSAIVNAIVTERYPADQMQAVVNNYLGAPDDEVIKGEMDDMQDWRAFAKRVAKEALKA